MVDSTQQVNKSFLERDLIFPIELRKTTHKETREYHLKKVFELSKPRGDLVFYVDGSISRNGKIIAEEPTSDQKEWVLSRISHSNTWPKVHKNKIGESKKMNIIHINTSRTKKQIKPIKLCESKREWFLRQESVLNESTHLMTVTSYNKALDVIN